MFKKNKPYDPRGELYSHNDMIDYEPSNSKEIALKKYNSSNIYNQDYYDVNKNDKSFKRNLNTNYQKTNTIINNQAYHQLKKININRPNLNTDEKNRKIIQRERERISNNIPSNYYTNPINHSQKINNYINTSQNNIENQSDKKIKNIPISLKKINLNKKRSFSKQSSDFNISETNINKSPYKKRKPSEGLDFNNNRKKVDSNSNSNSNLYNHISPRKQNLIPKPTQKYTPKKRNSFNVCNNISFGNKKIDKNLVEQSKDIKRRFKQIENERYENEIMRRKNEYFLKRGILLEKRIIYEAFATIIQAFFRGFYIRKRFYSLIDNCIKIRNAIYLLQKVFSFRKYDLFNILRKYSNSNVRNNKINNNSVNFRSRPVKKHSFINNDNNLDNKLERKDNWFRNVVIDKNNHIEINISKKRNPQNIIIDKNNFIEIYLPKKENKKDYLFKERKYILKYFLLKKEETLKKKMKIYFEKYKSKIINDKLKKKEENIISKQDTIYLENNIEGSKIKILRNIIKVKLLKNKEKLHVMLVKFYYNTLYIHINWYMYVINQLNYYQSLYQNNTSYNYPQNNNTSNQIANPTEFKSKLSENIDNISIENIDKINETISNEAKESKELEKHKLLKDIINKKMKEMQNNFHQMFTKFYYQGLLLEKSKNQNDEKNEENKENNIVIITDKNNEEEKENKLDENNNNVSTRVRGKKLEKKDTVTERRNKARNLRKLMMKREKDKLENLRINFYKFEINGMLHILKKNSRLSRLTKKKSNSTQNVLTNLNLENMENNKIEDIKELTLLDKKRIEEEKKKKELEKKRIEILKSIFHKKDRQITLVKRKTFEKWNLRAKFFSLISITKNGKRELAKSVRFKKKKISKNDRTKSEYKRDNRNNDKDENETI